MKTTLRAQRKTVGQGPGNIQPWPANELESRLKLMGELSGSALRSARIQLNKAVRAEIARLLGHADPRTRTDLQLAVIEKVLLGAHRSGKAAEVAQSFEVETRRVYALVTSYVLKFGHALRAPTPDPLQLPVFLNQLPQMRALVVDELERIAPEHLSRARNQLLRITENVRRAVRDRLVARREPMSPDAELPRSVRIQLAWLERHFCAHEALSVQALAEEAGTTVSNVRTHRSTVEVNLRVALRSELREFLGADSFK